MRDMTMGERIRFLRKKKGLSQEQLAQEIGVTKSTISKYELDARFPKHSTLDDFCRVFNVDFYMMLTGKTKSEWTSDFELDDKAFWENISDVLLSDYLMEIKQLLEQLNDEGQQKAIERVEELTEIPKYKKDPPQD